MEKWLMIIGSNSKDAKREAEFNDWYDKIHIPDVLSIPDFKKATRYQIMGGPKGEEGKYLAIYEIATTDIKKTMEAHAGNMARVRGSGRFSELFQRSFRYICKVENY